MGIVSRATRTSLPSTNRTTSRISGPASSRTRKCRSSAAALLDEADHAQHYFYGIGVLTKDAFLKKFKPLDLETGSMSKQLLEYICTDCQPKSTGKNPVDNLTAEEVAYVLSLVDKVTDED